MTSSPDTLHLLVNRVRISLLPLGFISLSHISET